jgi:hypothetical protein
MEPVTKNEEKKKTSNCENMFSRSFFKTKTRKKIHFSRVTKNHFSQKKKKIPHKKKKKKKRKKRMNTIYQLWESQNLSDSAIPTLVPLFNSPVPKENGPFSALAEVAKGVGMGAHWGAIPGTPGGFASVVFWILR